LLWLHDQPHLAHTMTETPEMTDATTSERLARDFFRRVWAPPHDLAAIDDLMTEDYRITTAGTLVEGRENFKAWVAQMQRTVGAVVNEHLEVFTSATGDRVVSRFVTRGTNEGLFGLPADGRPFAFTGIAIWRVAGDRLAECWVERSAFELYNQLRI
jgi:ketosteroid isomerase-like protein